jgi:hypothetical protein
MPGCRIHILGRSKTNLKINLTEGKKGNEEGLDKKLPMESSWK